MKPLIGGLVGALLTGIAVFGWHARPATTSVEPVWTAGPASPSAVRQVSGTLPVPGTAAAGAPVVVRCEPGQRAVVRQVQGWNGETTTEAGCVSDPNGFVTLAPAGGVIDPTAVRPVRYVSDERLAPQRVVYRDRPVRRVTRQRSWQKRALVIGGSAGAGAGIGALAGGKKGALLGAAIGGGAGTVYELLHK